MTKFTKANWMTRQLAENLCVMGEQLKMARMRRNLTMEIVAKHTADRFHVHAVLERHGREGVTQVMKAPASGGTAFDRAKAARKRARAAPVTHFIAGSRQNDCTRCAKKYPPFFVAAFDLAFVYVRLAAAPVGVQIFLQRLLYWLRSSG